MFLLLHKKDFDSAIVALDTSSCGWNKYIFMQISEGKVCKVRHVFVFTYAEKMELLILCILTIF